MKDNRKHRCGNKREDDEIDWVRLVLEPSIEMVSRKLKKRSSNKESKEERRKEVKKNGSGG